MTDGAVRACIQTGACTVKDLGERCGAGTRCGGCLSVLTQLLAEANLPAFGGLDPCPA